MFLFQISNYDDLNLDAETEELLRQRLEAHSRQVAPGIWSVTDHLNARFSEGPGREKRRVRYRIYGVLLIVLGVFTLVPGLMEPRIPALILAGGFAILVGLSEFCLVRERKAAPIPSPCQREAKTLLEGRRAVDWSKSRVKVQFDEAGMEIGSGEVREVIPYHKITGLFETEHLWLFIYEGEKALLLQKKDLVAGETDAFSSYVLPKISAAD